MTETAFTPLASLAGGALIGLAASLLMLTLGRVLGATGILAGAIRPASTEDLAWRLALLAGMVTAPGLMLVLTGEMPDIEIPVPTPALVIGGLLVGIGVTLGGGCTSGHGVCGIARLSTRSFAATAVFLLCAGITVFVIRHGIGG